MNNQDLLTELFQNYSPEEYAELTLNLSKEVNKKKLVKEDWEKIKLLNIFFNKAER